MVLLADRKKLRQIRDIARQQGWLNIERDLPTDEELSQWFKPQQKPPQQSLAVPYKAQIEKWVKQGIQASTIHAVLQR